MRRVALLVLLWLAATGTLLADTVDDLRDSVNEPWKPTAPSTPKKKLHWEDAKPDDCDCDHDCDDGTSVESGLFWAASVAVGTAATSPIWAPAVLVDDCRQRTGWFSRFPYQFGD